MAGVGTSSAGEGLLAWCAEPGLAEAIDHALLTHAFAVRAGVLSAIMLPTELAG